MSKYIDAEKLRSVLQNTINSMKEKDVKGERYDAFLNGKLSICEELLGCIDSLQQEPTEWSEEDEEILDAMIDMVSNSLYEPLFPREGMLAWLKSLRPHPAKSPLAEGVYYIKDGQPVAEYKDGVETDRLLVIGKYCRFYLSMADLGEATYEDAQNKAASLGEDWRCPDSFEGRTIGKMSKEICEKAAKIGAKRFKRIGWFWTNEVFDRWGACGVYFTNGNVNTNGMLSASYVLALSAFQN